MTEIKICGLKNERDIAYANILCPDMVGFVFVKKSLRFVSVDQASILRKKLGIGIHAVGVFADVSPKIPAEYVKMGVIDMIQLHGEEDEAYIRNLKTMTKARVIKAFSVKTAEDIRRAQTSPADLILLDSGSGGTGACFDWTLTANIDRPFFLAGGLSGDNVIEAIARTGCTGVDISSGVETGHVKDYNKMKNFIQTVRSGDQNRRAR